MRMRIAAGVASLVIAIPTGLWIWLQQDSRPASGPISSTWDRAAREVAIPGVDFALDKQVHLIDAVHAWAYVDECPHSSQSESCRAALGVTADGGSTWRRVNMPGKTGEAEYSTAMDHEGARWLPLNATTASLVTRGEIYLTRDQGASWTSYPLDDPPLETQLAANLADNFGSRNGDYAYLCARASILERIGQECTSMLTLLGTGPVEPQPHLTGPAGVTQGGDGRIWLIRILGDDQMQIAVSPDGGKSWQELPPTTIGGLQLSPDGSKAIIAHHIRQWRLDGQRWVEFPGMYDGEQMTDAIVRNDGQIAGVLGNKGVYLSADNRVTEIAGMPEVEAVNQLSDGTVIFQTWAQSEIMYVGTSQGWFTLKLRPAQVSPSPTTFPS